MEREAFPSWSRGREPFGFLSGQATLGVAPRQGLERERTAPDPTHIEPIRAAPKPESTARIGSSPASPVMARTSHAWPLSHNVKAGTTPNLSTDAARRATRFPKSVDPGYGYGP